MKRFTKSILAVLFCSLMLIGTVVLAAQKQNTVQAYAEEGVTSFVSRLYTVILGRPADEEGLESWVSQLSAGTKTGVDVTEGFILSEEFLEKGLSDEEFVQTLYRAFFDREADEGGLATWLDRLEQGYVKEYVFKQFAGSDEFEDLCESYGIPRGVVRLTQAEQTPNLPEKEYAVWEFVERFYVEFLGRPADYDGLKGWADKLLAGTMSGVEVAEGFFVSEEFQNKVLTNEEYVHTLYRAFFNRPADEGGLEKWVGRLENGYVKKNVFGGLAVSDEFEDLCESYGIARGEVYLTLAEQTPNLSEKEFNVWQFVERFYMEVLGRIPDLGGLKSWADKLLAGTASGAEVAEGFIFSDEFVNKNVGNEEYIKIMYRAFFGREADTAGLDSWLEKLYSGETRRMAFAGFVNSEEFGALCNSYEIKQGTVAALEGAPEKPYGNNHYDSVNVFWHTVNGATQYGIWRSTTGAKDSYTCVETVEDTYYYYDTDVKSGTLYYYKISALDPGTGKHTALSEPFVIFHLSGTEFSKIMATSSTTITMEWPAVSDASGYQIVLTNFNDYEETFIIDNPATTSLTITDLQPEMGYEARICTYKTVDCVGTFYSVENYDRVDTPVPEENQTGTYEYEELDDGTLMLTYYEGNESNVVIPKELDGKKVTVIGDYCFSSYDTILTVEIPNTITHIYEGAFESCYNLKEINIPDSVTYIGEYAFDYCESLTKLHIPASVESMYIYVEEYDDELYYYQQTLYGLYNLTAFTVDAANPSYTAVNGILYNKDKTQLICVPDAYEGVVTIANTVTNMEVYGTFDGCRYVTEIVIPKDMEYFDNCIYNCESLKKYTVANGNEYYATIDGVLYDINTTALISVPCAGIEKSYSIRSGVIYVDDYAFYSCDFMEQVYVPASVEWLGAMRGVTRTVGSKDNKYENCYGNIFNYCYQLNAITVDDTNKYYKSEDGVLFSKDGKVLVSYPVDREGETYAVPNGVTAIGEEAFSAVSNLSTVSLPASVEVLQPWAFSYAYVETIEFSEGLKVVGYSAFSYSSIVAATLPDSVERIDQYAFRFCRELENIKLSSHLTKIEKGAFINCRLLHSITIPEGVTEIQEQAFSGCRELEEALLPSTLKTIGKAAFTGCALHVIQLPDGLQSIDETAFLGCKDLTIIASPGSVGAEFAEQYGYNLE